MYSRVRKYESTFEGTKVLSYFRTLYSTFGYVHYIILFMIEHCMNSVYALYVYVYVGIFSVLSISGRLISCFIVLSYFRPEIDIYVVLVHVQYHTSGSTGTSVLPGARAYTFVRVFCHEYVFRWLFSNYVEEYLKLRQFTLIQGLKGVGQ